MDADFGVRAADPVDAAIALHQPDRVPGQVVVDEDAAVLEILPFRENVRADENVDLLVRRACQSARNRGELTDDVAPLIGVVATVDAANVWVSGQLEPLGIV